ncbi:MAG: serine/threonine-protein kinase [Polyangiaceae bacterium]
MAEASQEVSSTESSEADAMIGRDLNGKFTITSPIAKGGMGAVYRAKQAPLGRICAVKVLIPRPENIEHLGEGFHRRFFLEASTAAKLTHPNTVTIYDYGKTDDGVYFMAMEYLEGRTLSKAIKTDGPFAEERAIHVAMQVCRSLREAHALGVMHRDIKPANIYLVEHGDETDFVKVLDFGLVKDVDPDGEATEELTQAGVFMGSPKYMSPEQIQGGAIDARTDIYSLGIVLFEMVAGRPPFDKNSSIENLMAHMKTPPPPVRDINPSAQISPAFEALINKCLAKSADDRFLSMDELLLALKKVQFGGQTGQFLATAELPSASGNFGSGPQNINSTSGQHIFLASSTGTQSLSDPAAQNANKGSSNKILFGVIGLAVAAAAAFAVVKSSTPKPAPAPAVTAPAKVEPAQTAAPKVETPAPTVEAPKEVKLRIDSEPTGATVRLNDDKGKELCSGTPCDVTFEKGTTEMTVAIVKAGYVIVTKTIKATDSKLSVPLVKVAATPAVGGGAKSNGGGTGYKGDPFGGAPPPY